MRFLFINNVEKEVQRMEIRMKRWDTQINELNDNISEAMTSSTITKNEKDDLQREIIAIEDEITKKRELSFRKVKNECEMEIAAGETQFLLKYVDQRYTACNKMRNKRYSRGNTNNLFRQHVRQNDNFYSFPT